MNKNLRSTNTKLIERILRKEDSLLKGDLPSYFKDLPENQGVSVNEEGSAYESEVEHSDSFDDDFGEIEDSSENDDEGENDEKIAAEKTKTGDEKNQTEIKKFKLRAKIVTSFKNKKDRYFKKGFDIKNLNFDLYKIDEEEPETKKSKKKHREIAVNSMRHNFLHEAYSQRLLLKNAMAVERNNMLHSFWANSEANENENGKAWPERAEDDKSRDFLVKVLWDDQLKKPITQYNFFSEGKVENFFSIDNFSQKKVDFEEKIVRSENFCDRRNDFLAKRKEINDKELDSIQFLLSNLDGKKSRGLHFLEKS